MTRQNQFRIAVRRYPAFEQAISAQWHSFESEARTGLTLDAIPYELPELEDALFHQAGLKDGSWDVAFIATDWIAAMHSANAAIDLTPYAPDPAPYPESLLRLQRIEGQILGVPYHDGPECLIFRRDLFDSPENQSRYQALHGKPLSPPRTWADFHQIARFFHAPDQNRYGTVFAAFPDGHNSVYDFLLQLWTRSGDLFDKHGIVRFSTPEAAEALDFYRTILSDPEAVHPHCKTCDSVQAGLAFARGEAAMMVNWFGFATHAHTAPDSLVRGQIDIADIPGDPSVSLNVYWILSIAAGSPHREIASRFLQHCGSAEMDRLTTTSGAIGCRKSTWADPGINAAIPFYNRLAGLHAAAREIPQRPDWPRIAAIIDQLVTAAITTQTPTQTLLERADALASEIDPDLTRGNKRLQESGL